MKVKLLNKLREDARRNILASWLCGDEWYVAHRAAAIAQI